MTQSKSTAPISFLDRMIAAVSPSAAVKRMQARRMLELTGYYRSASTSRIRSNWLSGGNSDATPPAWELQALRARARDANRNDPVAKGATETLIQNILGSGLRPQSRIRGDQLGVSKDHARNLQKQVETIFSNWAKWSDAAGILTFDEMQQLSLRKIIEDGEIIIIPTWSSESWRPLSRTIELVEADRLVAPGARSNMAVNGIEFNAAGCPTKYWIKQAANKGSNAAAADAFTGIAARDADGRPKIIHVFRVDRVGQTRGVPFFASVLSYLKDLADYLEAEVISARVAACLAVFITKQDPMQTAFNLSGTTESTGDRIQSIEPGLVGYLNPGESINVVDPKRPGDAFPSFIETMLRIIGGALGIPYELLAKDFSKTNYSSARASILEGRRMFMQWRTWFADKFCQPMLELVLEEAYLRGAFTCPDFYKNKTELCRVQWLGGGWGWVDPVKEIKASTSAVDANLSTLAEEAANQGRDWEEILEQRATEKGKIDELGLSVVEMAPAGTAAGTGTDKQGQAGTDKVKP